jgi:hypothetical protein
VGGLYKIVAKDLDNRLKMVVGSFFFNTLYLWTIAYVSSLVLSFHDFLFLIARYFLLYNSHILGAPYAFNSISITYKKNIYIHIFK